MSENELTQRGSDVGRRSVDRVLVGFVMTVVAAIALGASGLL
jgi:hypothetical protein